jgi:BlaI family penicillinase repressor
MARPASTQPTEVELSILRILWKCGPCTARTIHDELTREKETNYSTTVKMLAVMFEKGLIARDETTSPMTFTSAVSQAVTRESVLTHIIRRLYDGSAKSLVLQVLSSGQATPEDLDEIRALIQELEAKRPGSKRR